MRAGSGRSTSVIVAPPDVHDAPLVLRQAHEEALRGEVPDFHFVGPRAGHARDELHEGGLRRAVLHLQHDAAVGLAGSNTEQKDHQKQERVQAHVLVCFLSYVLWKTLGQMCRPAGLGDEPQKVLEELGSIQVVDVIMPTRCGQGIRRRVSCGRRPIRRSCWIGWVCSYRSD